MAALVIAEHDNVSLKPATLNTVAAALQCGGEVHVLVAGADAGAAAQAAAAIVGVSKVLHADGASLAHGLAENLADLLARFVVPTNGLEPLAFAQLCLQSFICDGATFDEEGFFAALAEEIVRPRRRAQAWLAEHRTLTRLYTSMSAEDMTLDPEFRFDAGIEPVSNVHTADVVTLCDPTQYQLYAPQEIRLADGTRAVFRAAIPIVDDDAFCRAQGSPGADDGCNLHVGADRSTTRALAIASMVLLALGLRRRRRASLSGPRSGRLET